MTQETVTRDWRAHLLTKSDRVDYLGECVLSGDEVQHITRLDWVAFPHLEVAVDAIVRRAPAVMRATWPWRVLVTEDTLAVMADAIIAAGLDSEVNDRRFADDILATPASANESDRFGRALYDVTEYAEEMWQNDLADGEACYSCGHEVQTWLALAAPARPTGYGFSENENDAAALVWFDTEADLEREPTDAEFLEALLDRSREVRADQPAAAAELKSAARKVFALMLER